MTEQAPDSGSLLRFATHLFPAGNDLTLIILKGHLLLEEELNARLREIALRPQALQEARLRFHALSRVCMAFLYGANSAEQWFWSAIASLNSIRNDLAHHLDPPQLETKIDAMLQALERDVPSGLFASSGSRADRTRQALAFLYGVAQGMRKKQKSGAAHGG
jgi:hypothetical protein